MSLEDKIVTLAGETVRVAPNASFTIFIVGY